MFFCLLIMQTLLHRLAIGTDSSRLRFAASTASRLTSLATTPLLLLSSELASTQLRRLRSERWERVLEVARPFAAFLVEGGT